MLRHGFHSPEAQQGGSIQIAHSVHLEGRTPEGGASLAHFLPEVPVDAPERALRCRVAVAGTFLAGLELTRDGSIAVQQEIAWASVHVRRGQGPVPSEAVV